MPVRSLSSSVLKWPNRETVDKAVRQWAARFVKNRPEIIRLGYFGSYARGDWGVGSDLDLVAVIEESDESFERRSLKWNIHQLPVPAQVLVYTREEWEFLKRTGQSICTDSGARNCLGVPKEYITPQLGRAWICHCLAFRGKAIPKARLLRSARNDTSNFSVTLGVDLSLSHGTRDGNLRSFRRLLRSARNDILWPHITEGLQRFSNC